MVQFPVIVITIGVKDLVPLSIVERYVIGRMMICQVSRDSLAFIPSKNR